MWRPHSPHRKYKGVRRDFHIFGMQHFAPNCAWYRRERCDRFISARRFPRKNRPSAPAQCAVTLKEPPQLPSPTHSRPQEYPKMPQPFSSGPRAFFLGCRIRVVPRAHFVQFARRTGRRLQRAGKMEQNSHRRALEAHLLEEKARLRALLRQQQATVWAKQKRKPRPTCHTNQFFPPPRFLPSHKLQVRPFPLWNLACSSQMGRCGKWAQLTARQR